MHWDQDEENAFPARHPREPGGLRRDILDEIADHLACAAAAEEEQSGETDEATLWQLVRERFGDPDVLARKLWWGSMRETIMREWIQTAVLAVLAVAGIAGVVFMGLMLRQFGATNEAVLTALSLQQAGEARWATLELEFRRGSADGPLAEGVEVACFGKMFGEDRAADERTVDESGTVRIGPMQPGVYTMKCSDSRSGLHLERDVMLYASGAPEHILVVVPDVEPREVEVVFDAPAAAISPSQLLGLTMYSKWESGGDTWHGKLQCLFGPEGGRSATSSFMEPNQNSLLGALGDIVIPESRVASVQNPVRASGSLGDYCGGVILRADGENWKGHSHSGFTLVPETGSDSNYRAVPREEMAIELEDWALYDQMTAQGLSVTKELASAIRQAYPEHQVTSTTPVPESTMGVIDPRGYFTSRVDRSQVFETLSVHNVALHYYEIDGVDTPVNIVATPIFKLPGKAIEFDHQRARVILAFYAASGSLREFNNPLEAWPVQNNVFSMPWPREGELSRLCATGVPNLELGDGSVASISLEAMQKSDWQFVDVTEANRNHVQSHRGILLKWKFDGEDYDNSLEIVSAEAKRVEHEHQRPLWLVLEPTSDSGGAG